MGGSAPDRKASSHEVQAGSLPGAKRLAVWKRYTKERAGRVKLISPLETISRLPPGWAIIGRDTDTRATTPEIGWYLREEGQRIKALASTIAGMGPSEVLQLRGGVVIKDGVAVIPVLLRLGPLHPRNIWATWLNLSEPGWADALTQLIRQPRIAVHLVGDRGTVEQFFTFDNTFRSFAINAAAATKGLPSWSALRFEQLKVRLCQQHPDMMSLWHSLKTPDGVQDEVQQFPETIARRQSLDPDAESLQRTESAYRSLSLNAQELLVCLAPFTGAVNGGALDAYVKKLKKEPALTMLPLHQWEEAIRECHERRLLGPHPVDRAYLAIPPALTVILRRQLETDTQAAMHWAIDTAFRAIYQTGVRSAQRLLTSSDPAEVEGGRVFMHLEYDNMLAALERALRAGGRSAPSTAYSMNFFSTRGTTNAAWNWVLASWPDWTNTAMLLWTTG